MSLSHTYSFKMSSSTYASILHLLSFTLLLQIVLGASPTPLFHFCSNSGNFTANGPYRTNLNKLMGSLYLRAPPTGFGAVSVGSNQTRANGLALCRGDVNATDCKSCVAEAGGEIRKRCPYNKGVVIWYDDCLYKYSNVDFFGKIDDENKFYVLNSRNVSMPKSFDRMRMELLGRLAKEAYVKPTMFAVGEVEVEESMKLYGLVQCTRDLSRVDCKKCLDTATNELPRFFSGLAGGRVVGGSCNIRYEIYPFVNA